MGTGGGTNLMLKKATAYHERPSELSPKTGSKRQYRKIKEIIAKYELFINNY